MENLSLVELNLEELDSATLQGTDGGILPIVAWMIAGELITMAAAGLAVGIAVNN